MRRILAGRRAKLILCKFAEGSASQGSQERRYEGVRTSVSGHSGIPKSPWMRLRPNEHDVSWVSSTSTRGTS